MSTDPRDGESDDQDLVARNRATPARSTPDRSPVGADVTNLVRRITGAVLLVATLVLVVAVVAERVT